MSTPNNVKFLTQNNNTTNPGGGASRNPIGATAGNGNTPKVITRTLCMNFEGNLNDLARQGPTAGLWKATQGRESVLFQPNLADNINPEQNANLMNSLRTGVIKKLTVREHKSTFPFILGVDINCVPPSEVTDIGEKFTYTVLPNSNISVPQVVYQCSNEVQDNTNWHQLYSKWNATNLEKEGVMDVPNQNFLFVHMDHPVIGLLRFNQNMIGCDIDAQPKLEGEYLKVAKQVMATCCQTIREDVFDKMKTNDLTVFMAQLKRLNGLSWDELDHNATLGLKLDQNLDPEEQRKIKAAHIKEYMTKTYQYMARLEVEYEISGV